MVNQLLSGVPGQAVKGCPRQLTRMTGWRMMPFCTSRAVAVMASADAGQEMVSGTCRRCPLQGPEVWAPGRRVAQGRARRDSPRTRRRAHGRQCAHSLGTSAPDIARQVMPRQPPAGWCAPARWLGIRHGTASVSPTCSSGCASVDQHEASLPLPGSSR